MNYRPTMPDRAKEFAAGALAGSLMAYLIALLARSDSNFGATIFSPEVIGAALGAGITIGGTIIIARYEDWAARADRRNRYYAIANAALITISRLERANGFAISDLEEQLRREMRTLEELCRINPPDDVATTMCLIDVREEWEREQARLSAVLLPLTMYHVDDVGTPYEPIVSALQRTTVALVALRNSSR
jgi:hypothetical protein